MEWTGALNNPTINSLMVNIHVHGSMLLISNMSIGILTKIYFKAKTKGNIIRTANQTFKCSLIFDGIGAEWTVQDSLLVDGDIHHNYSAIKIINNYVRANLYYSNANASQRELVLGNNILEISSVNIRTDNFKLQAGTSTFYSNTFYQTGSNGLNFYNVFFRNLGSLSSNTSTPALFNHVKMMKGGVIIGENHFDSLSFYPGMKYSLDHSRKQVIKKHWLLRGNNCFPIILQSTQFGVQAKVEKASGNVSADFVQMRDNCATGGAFFYAGTSSSNIANNTGWIFNNSPGYIFGLGKDTTLCLNESYVLNTNNFNGGQTFLWFNGSTAPTCTVSATGIYWVTVGYALGCEVTDSINLTIYPLPDIHLPNDTLICEGNKVKLEAPTGFINYLWNTGSTSNSITVSNSGTYILEVKDDKLCTNKDTFNLTVLQLPKTKLGKDRYLCIGDTIKLWAGEGFKSYLWNTGDTVESIFISDPGYYWVHVTNICGETTDSIYLNPIDCEFWAPNVFTPNQDGWNDDFEIICKGAEDFSVQIFNRWGNLVFESNNIEKHWDGCSNGVDCPTGVYYFTASYYRRTLSGNRQKFLARGSVTLYR